MKLSVRSFWAAWFFIGRVCKSINNWSRGSWFVNDAEESSMEQPKTPAAKSNLPRWKRRTAQQIEANKLAQKRYRYFIVRVTYRDRVFLLIVAGNILSLGWDQGMFQCLRLVLWYSFFSSMSNVRLSNRKSGRRTTSWLYAVSSIEKTRL